MHPKTIDHIRNFLAKQSFITLICSYILGTVVVALFIGVLYLITDNAKNNFSFYKWCLYSFLQLYSYEIPSVKINFESYQGLVSVITQVLKVIFPALFLGAVIFKLFVSPRVFSFRKKCSIFYDPERQETVLAVRA